MVENLRRSDPRDVMSVTPDGVYGRVCDALLTTYEQRSQRYTRAEQFVLALIDQQRAGLERCLAEVDPQRVAVVMGTTAGGIAEAELTRKPGHVFDRHYDFRFQRLGQIARFTAERLGAEGLVTGVSTACTSGARAIGLGMRWLQLNWCDLAIVGGVDASCRMTSQGFASLEALSPGYCRPFDVERDGINLGEGGALFALSRARSHKGSRVVFTGYGESIDAWHISAPHPEGDGIARAMESALSMAGYRAGNVGYVNMHGTGTPHNDDMEAKAVIKVLGTGVPVSSTKPMTGHALGAAGALEAAIGYALLQGDLEVLPIQHGMQTQDSQFERLQVITEAGRQVEKPVVMSNSCGFGGHNTCLVLALGAH